ncbi:uncharacterized protein BO95DRAFT_443608 [Aspergillus brunneoviolaceus CBS 621.78]|uniref:Uncharacterized protein n=1 Tax=Aspergillus brunneoviolaceus CBS 621.78 TaxID=1450534 RepID=A0ACD1G6Z7_9EURO|nr:hypothetical protein BO95DRAFT_443608 [Aspergillus brunneoviolaceus CBS 621.78]RAH44896.1 hypothetical protein BO95DRAFT_443608 [Aspergillus brunneoviolaceus CBS 621.78]
MTLSVLVRVILWDTVSWLHAGRTLESQSNCWSSYLWSASLLLVSGISGCAITRDEFINKFLNKGWPPTPCMTGFTHPAGAIRFALSGRD